MGHPLRLSDGLMLDARLTSELADRSIAGQIEHWAHLGQAIEPLLRGNQILALKKAGKVKPLSYLMESIDGEEGRRRLADYLKATPFPHYQPAPGKTGLLIRIDKDGKKTIGRFVKRKFVPAP